MSTLYERGELRLTILKGPNQLSASLVLMPDLRIHTWSSFSNSLIFAFVSHTSFLMLEHSLRLMAALSRSSHSCWSPTLPSQYYPDHPGPTPCIEVGVVSRVACFNMNGLIPADLLVYILGSTGTWGQLGPNYPSCLRIWIPPKSVFGASFLPPRSLEGGRVRT